MINWKNLDTLSAYKKLAGEARVNLPAAMSGKDGAARVAKYSVPMAGGLSYSFAAKAVDGTGRASKTAGVAGKASPRTGAEG